MYSEHEKLYSLQQAVELHMQQESMYSEQVRLHGEKMSLYNEHERLYSEQK